MMIEANKIVKKVNRHMSDMAGAVMEITRSSEETGKIIKMIDESAFQTNLPALNAAVEAVRVGEAVAGFTMCVTLDPGRNEKLNVH
jgi:methyl-accepting chemotaxis protein